MGFGCGQRRIRGTSSTLAVFDRDTQFVGSAFVNVFMGLQIVEIHSIAIVCFMFDPRNFFPL